MGKKGEIYVKLVMMIIKDFLFERNGLFVIIVFFMVSIGLIIVYLFVVDFLWGVCYVRI